MSGIPTKQAFPNDRPFNPATGGMSPSVAQADGVSSGATTPRVSPIGRPSSAVTGGARPPVTQAGAALSGIPRASPIGRSPKPGADGTKPSVSQAGAASSGIPPTAVLLMCMMNRRSSAAFLGAFSIRAYDSSLHAITPRRSSGCSAMHSSAIAVMTSLVIPAIKTGFIGTVRMGWSVPRGVPLLILRSDPAIFRILIFVVPCLTDTCCLLSGAIMGSSTFANIIPSQLRVWGPAPLLDSKHASTQGSHTL